ncbi:MAG: hypothetical protein ACFFDT_32965 [Candidatus Hodarchaeota archaeon]
MPDNKVINEEIEKLIKKVVEKNKLFLREHIEFTPYCERKMKDRNIAKELVLDTIKGDKAPYFAGIQEILHKKNLEIRHKLIYKISNKYSLIIIVVYSANILKVINVIKTSKSAEKLWRKKILG